MNKENKKESESKEHTESYLRDSKSSIKSRANKADSHNNTESTTLDSHTNKAKSFDPLLFNGLGSDRERWWNNHLYAFMTTGGFFLWFFSMFIASYRINFGFGTLVFIGWLLLIFLFAIYLVFWLYLHISLFINGRKNKHIDKSNPLLVCEYQGSFKNYCVWILEFIVFSVMYIFCILLCIVFFVPTISIVFMHLYWSKPFLLKRILLFEDCVVIEYRIFGNIKLSRENLALMRLPQTFEKITDFIYANTAFVRPVIVDNTKDPYLIANFCTRFNSFGLSNLDKLWKELDSQLGYSAEKITGKREMIGKKRERVFNFLAVYIKDEYLGNNHE
ncbi:hypothetical protein [Helicobacter didelphidarum]|uniref:hypothetical protein n=1 Tax=Helicobacter didelphidarum TaxID=2040648 RepID=UPI0015F1B7AA|nr:hypothetical protein [Helicobacter didelphidarum]